ncbi:MAG: diguanylate cyclase [Alteromonadaceae bacterium]|nr:MAG: diguanylate cyclase [Alteromonadaceae bacterium]
MPKLTNNWNTVKSKLLRTIVLSFSIGIFISGSLLLLIGHNFAKSNMLDGLKIAANIIADRSAAALIFLDQEAAIRNLSSAKSQDNIDFLCLYDINGQLFASYAFTYQKKHCDETVTPKQVEDISEQKDIVTIVIPVKDRSDFIGSLYIQANTKPLLESKILFSFVILSVLLLSLSVAFWVGNKLVKHALKPLDALYETSKVIANNPLSPDRAEKISQDEIGRVVDVFNKMLDTISQENEALIDSENRFRTLSENSPIGVFLKYGHSDYKYINSKWAEISGLTTSTASSFFECIAMPDQEKYLKTIDDAIHQLCPKTIEYRFIHQKLGSRVLMEYISPIENGARLIGSLLDVTELKTAQNELEKLAFYDPLTQLPNRRFFKDHLDFAIASAERDGGKFAVYMTDLDDFKKVNDSLGHDVGDNLLIRVAESVRNALGEGDVISRMGGDEFMILINGADDSLKLDNTCKRLVEALCISTKSDSQEVEVTGSIGVAIYPTDAKRPEDLVRCADIALYNAKAHGGNQASYFSLELSRRIREKLRLENKLRRALDNNLLEVYIQPQYLASTLEICWSEALVRWNDKDDGFISPEDFIPLAEETGLIHRLGDYVLNEVLAILSKHGEQLSLLGIDGIAVNLSAKQFFSTSFSNGLAEKFSKYQVDPKKIEFELTETTVTDDVDLAVVIMEQIRSLGCRLSLDDFGTGYSSFSYLKRFPLTSLKIDRSFIQDTPHQQHDVEICCAIIAMAHILGLSVVAEGVETQVQADFLAKNNCEYLQGFYLDNPLSIDELLNRANKKQEQEQLCFADTTSK